MMMRKKRLRLLQSGKSTQPLISKKCRRKRVKTNIRISSNQYGGCQGYVWSGCVIFFWHVTFQDLYENIERSDEGEVLMSKVVLGQKHLLSKLCQMHSAPRCCLLNQISCPQTSGMESHILPSSFSKFRGVTQSFNGKFNINISHDIRIKVIVKVSWWDRFLSIKFEHGCLFLKREGYNMSHKELFKEVVSNLM